MKQHHIDLQQALTKAHFNGRLKLIQGGQICSRGEAEVLAALVLGVPVAITLALWDAGVRDATLYKAAAKEHATRPPSVFSQKSGGRTLLPAALVARDLVLKVAFQFTADTTGGRGGPSNSTVFMKRLDKETAGGKKAVCKLDIHGREARYWADIENGKTWYSFGFQDEPKVYRYDRTELARNVIIHAIKWYEDLCERLLSEPAD